MGRKLQNKKKGLWNIGKIESQVVYSNAHAVIVHDACKVCWDMPPEKLYTKKLEYIAKRVKTGHESVMEHSNIIMLIVVAQQYATDILTCMTAFEFLHTNVKAQPNGDLALLIGGSIRAYKHVFKIIDDQNNPIVLAIKKQLYSCTYREYYIDLINAGVMDAGEFIDPYEEEELTDEEKENLTEFEKELVSNSNPVPNRIETNNDKFEIVNMDEIEKCYEIVKQYRFDYNDLLDMCSITILFKDMSRIITQQLTRHRNAITQESQRYVDYSGAPFNDPADFKDKYDKDKIYAIDWFNEENQKLTIKATSANIGKMINSIYGQLRDQGMDKEDARAYLTNNTQCGKIYITFTFRKLIKFLELRVDPSAQAEIHKVYAIPIERMFKELVLTYLGDIYKYLLPKYMLTETDGDYSEIDEILEEVEEEI